MSWSGNGRIDISGVSLMDRISKKYIRASAGVADISDNMREHRLLWFSCAIRRDEEKDLIRTILELRVEDKDKLNWEQVGTIWTHARQT